MITDLSLEVIHTILQYSPGFVAYQLIGDSPIGHLACNFYYRHVYIVAAYSGFTFDQNRFIGLTKMLSSDHTPEFSSPRAFVNFCSETPFFQPYKVTIAGSHNLAVFQRKYPQWLSKIKFVCYEESLQDSMSLETVDNQVDEIILRNNSNFLLPRKVNSLILDNVKLQTHSTLKKLQLTSVVYSLEDLDQFYNLEDLVLDSCFSSFVAHLPRLKRLSIGQFCGADFSGLQNLQFLKIGTVYMDAPSNIPSSVKTLILDDPTFLINNEGSLPNLDYLSINLPLPSRLIDYDFCYNLPNLRTFYLDIKFYTYYNDALEDTHIIRLPNSIEKLRMTNTTKRFKNIFFPTSLQDLTIIQSFPYHCAEEVFSSGLRRLTISWVAGFNIDQLTNLQYLNLSISGCSKLDLSRLDKMEELIVRGSSIEHISLPPNLSILSLMCAKMKSFTGHSQLRTVKLHVENLSGTELGANIQELDIKLTGSCPIENIVIPMNLKHLKIQGDFEKIDQRFFSNLPECLVNLILDDCKSVIKPLKLPKSLRNLSLARNKLTETFPIDCKLICLNLSSNQLEDFNCFHMAESLEAIDLSKNCLSRIVGDLRHTKLHKMSLSKNYIKGGNLILPKTLQVIDTSHNEYESTEWLDFGECDRLNHIYLSFSKLNSFDNVRNLSELEEDELQIK